MALLIFADLDLVTIKSNNQWEWSNCSKMALDLSVKSRKRSFDESERTSPTPSIRTEDVDGDVAGRSTDAVLDLSMASAKKRSLSTSSACSDTSNAR